MKIKTNLLVAGLFISTALAFTGCATNDTVKAMPAEKAHSEVVLLREGDTVKISFPGSPNLDATQQIRRDGKITLSLVGEVDALGLTPDGLKQKLIELYASQISSKEINVALLSSTFPVFVRGQVIHPGKIMSDHPLTALDAIMEAGGFNEGTANLKAVRITRKEKGLMKTYQVNLKDVLDGKSDKSFYLQPEDIVSVPEKFQLF